MKSALLRFYLGIVLLVLLLFFSLNQLYNWFYQGDEMVEAARSMLHQVYHHSESQQLHCRLSDTDDCPNSLYVTYPKGYWQPQPDVVYGVEVMRDTQGNASMCSEMSGGELICLSQLNLPDGADFSIDLAHVFLLLLLLCLFWLSRNLFRDVDTLRRSALQEIKLGHLPAFQLSEQSYLQPLARSLSRMNQTIADLNSLQREMADTVCHDIKTPLARLRFVLLNLEQRLSTEQSAQISRNLQEIEDNVYDYLRLAQQNFRSELQLSDVRLDRLLQELIDKFATNTEHQIQLHSAGAVVLQADQKLLQRALSNLLSNALRYCQTKVWIEISLVQQDCLIDVCDDGEGWNSNREHNTDGLSHHGLGLAIVQRVARQHGGDFIRLQRAEGGAIARLKLPLGCADN
ncbi:sensor histidine kinase [Rheinheimera marina]|uniref:histidine kinase n=1 Tax=Rheinheimera marina TaxID=1774958 RepID=A0ABV9JKQ3_9GAMM